MKNIKLSIFLLLFFGQMFFVMGIFLFPTNAPISSFNNSLLLLAEGIHQFYFIFIFLLLLISCFKEVSMKYILISLGISALLLLFDMSLQYLFMRVYYFVNKSFILLVILMLLLFTGFFAYLRKRRRDKILLSTVMLVSLLISFYTLFAFDKLYESYVKTYTQEIKQIGNMNAQEIYNICKTGLYYCYVGEPSKVTINDDELYDSLVASKGGFYAEEFIVKTEVAQKAIVRFEKNGNVIYVAEYMRLLELKESLYLFFSFILAISSLFWSNLMILANMLHNFRQKIK